MDKHLQKTETKIPQKHHSIPADVLPNDSQDLFVDLPTTNARDLKVFFL